MVKIVETILTEGSRETNNEDKFPPTREGICGLCSEELCYKRAIPAYSKLYSDRDHLCGVCYKLLEYQFEKPKLMVTQTIKFEMRADCKRLRNMYEAGMHSFECTASAAILRWDTDEMREATQNMMKAATETMKICHHWMQVAHVGKRLKTKAEV